jgi:hypothetical protein
VAEAFMAEVVVLRTVVEVAVRTVVAAAEALMVAEVVAILVEDTGRQLYKTTEATAKHRCLTRTAWELAPLCDFSVLSVVNPKYERRLNGGVLFYLCTDYMWS